jgi:hypothetical protein
MLPFPFFSSERIFSLILRSQKYGIYVHIEFNEPSHFQTAKGKPGRTPEKSLGISDRTKLLPPPAQK